MNPKMKNWLREKIQVLRLLIIQLLT